MSVAITPAVLEAVNRASQRSRAVVREELKAGVYDLATIASIAPWIGLLGTTLTIAALPGYDGPAIGLWRLVLTHRATSMGYTAFGLVVGVVAFWFYRYLSERLLALDREMENASLGLLNHACPLMTPSCGPRSCSPSAASSSTRSGPDSFIAAPAPCSPSHRPCASFGASPSTYSRARCREISGSARE